MTLPGKTDRPARLTLGPLLFHWQPDIVRDFYFRIADEAPIDSVCLGEVVCPKRTAAVADALADAAERLQSAGKEVVYSTLALVIEEKDMKSVDLVAMDSDALVEANDASALAVLDGRAHVVGPFINVYNESTIGFLERHGAVRLCLPPELSRESLAILAAAAASEIEVQVFGRLPLAISGRCFHARAYDRHKDNCRLVCAKDPDGLTVETQTGEPFLAINGVQTMSYTCRNLLGELADLRALGIHRFRLSPHMIDMVGVAQVFRDVIDGVLTTEAGLRRLHELAPRAKFSNGYYHGREGLAPTGLQMRDIPRS